MPLHAHPSWVKRSLVGVTLFAVLVPLVATTASGAEPPAARDGFNRVVVNTWGVSTSGNPWTLRGDATRFSVADGAGKVALRNDARGQSADLGGWTETDTSVSVMVSVDTVPNANGYYANVVARRIPSAGQYLAKVRVRANAVPSVMLVRTDGATGAEIPLSAETPIPRLGFLSADSRVVVDVEAVGTNPTQVRARLYLPSGAPSSTWDVSATDATVGLQAAGVVSLNNYLSPSVTNGPITVSWSGLEVTASAPKLPDTPTGLAAANDPAGVRLSWSAIAGGDTYVVRRNGVVLWSGTATSLLDDQVAPSTAYTYTVSSRIAALESLPSPTVSITTPTPPVRAATTAGSATPGQTSYPVPAGALFVANSGSDNNAGTVTAPLRTISTAVIRATDGATIVVRAGTYNETVQVPANERLTIQSYPGETVWMDGSIPVTNWVTDGTIWRIDGWTPRFDRSPTYTPGAPDGTSSSWQFINPAYPLAAYPEQLFYDGVSLKQVASRAEVAAGTFFVDNSTSRIYLGSNPAGHSVSVTNLQQALVVRGPGSVVRGIGVQRYAPSVPTLGAVLAVAPSMTLENVLIRDSSTTGVFVGSNGGNNITLRKVTVERSGMLGISGSYADGITLDSVRVTDNNVERFNLSPVAGGIKITRTRGITVRDSTISRNIGNGLWMDESVYNAVVSGSDLNSNSRNGLSFEISSKLLLANNNFNHNGALGIILTDAQSVELWNNTFVDNIGRPMWIVQDSRSPTNPSTPGRDPRQAAPDPTVTWVLGPITLRNNVIARTGGNCLLCVEDTARKRTAEAIGVTAAGNLFVRTNASTPRWSVVWANGQPNPAVFTTLAAFTAATGQNPGIPEYIGTTTVDSLGRVSASVATANVPRTTPIPAAIAALVGKPTGTRGLGAWQ